MHRIARTIIPAVALLLAGGATSAQAQFTAYAVTTSNGTQQLVRFNPSAPGTVVTLGPTGVNLTGIDFRPATGQLYGYDGDLLYTLDLATGRATFAFDVNNTSGNAGVDFNPVVDRIRVVDATGTNLRLNQLTGMTTVDGPYTFAMGDANFGRTPSFTAVAYTNSDADPATGTTLFGIDATLGQLVTISSPNGGTVSTVGSLGIGTFTSVLGFDIVTAGGINTAFLAVTPAGSTMSRLYTLNLGNGAATLVDGVNLAGVQGLAVSTVPEPGTWLLLATGLAGLTIAVRRRKAGRRM